MLTHKPNNGIYNEFCIFLCTWQRQKAVRHLSYHKEVIEMQPAKYAIMVITFTSFHNSCVCQWRDEEIMSLERRVPAAVFVMLIYADNHGQANTSVAD